MSLKKHIIKRVSIFLAISLILFLLLYILSFFLNNGFDIGYFFIALGFHIFFSIAFLFFEASELKSKGESSNRMFNLITAIALTIILFTYLREVTYDL
ncbi:hypothetical protein [Flavobacterium capsici]|uniref:Uncharacterized protein n=1 Tax=Flavobacterium capsici TaxID=3075618 RepID=A0AA96F075_9FLAO|nr:MULTISPECIES: hypothetical protein [unclassified Flavobacterium]WNM20378.1 hypothetical protein RN608_06775 [Flavobacterium sp. PMR2A8]WNM21768.1 hypothetical protein RN605_00075 [Flavobacterium sp. PMTSA4]